MWSNSNFKSPYLSCLVHWRALFWSEVTLSHIGRSEQLNKTHYFGCRHHFTALLFLPFRCRKSSPCTLPPTSTRLACHRRWSALWWIAATTRWSPCTSWWTPPTCTPSRCPSRPPPSPWMPSWSRRILVWISWRSSEVSCQVGDPDGGDGTAVRMLGGGRTRYFWWWACLEIIYNVNAAQLWRNGSNAVITRECMPIF